jgi:hypothetical protein
MTGEKEKEEFHRRRRLDGWTMGKYKLLYYPATECIPGQTTKLSPLTYFRHRMDDNILRVMHE